MAGSSAVWGIDIGQCSLKAIRCHQGDSPDTLVADAFDYIAYPKILSQPGAEPAELIAEALNQFLSRNSVRGDRVAISVPGQNGLARFIKLPPVEANKIPDIVKYEARQQIPFDLADVIWDYQQMGGGAEEEGYALETEVGLFAMKRDQVYRHLQSFTDANIEVDIIQLAPLALCNFLLFDQMPKVPAADQFDPESPPPSTVILSLGTDATDLVVTNGLRVWQRSIPLGGNHFTKALTKELKLTFAKAEHLKCNAAAAPDPRALFQAMRPVFNDLLTEIQRSIGYFTSIDRNAKIEKIVGLGNGMKMPGLRKYLSQSLGIEVVRVSAFDHLTGPEVLGAPAFKENILSFGVAYGLAVQAAGGGRSKILKTNLLPPEIVKDRFIRSKKPWALAAAALLLLGCAIGYGNYSMALNSVAASKYQDAEQKINNVVSESRRLQGDAETAEQEFKNSLNSGKNLVGNIDNRVLWLELFRAVSESLPKDVPIKERSHDTREWTEIHIESFECQYVDNLATDWFAQYKNLYRKPGDIAGSLEQASANSTASPTPPTNEMDGTAAGTTDANAQAQDQGPQGPGWVIRLTGYHYHNPEATAGQVSDAQYVQDTLIRNLHEKEILLPDPKAMGSGDKTAEAKQVLVSMKDLGIGYPILIQQEKTFTDAIPDPFDTAAPSAGDTPSPPHTGLGGPGPRRPVVGGHIGGHSGLGTNDDTQKTIPVTKYKFVVDFCWQPRTQQQPQDQQANQDSAY